MTYTTLALAAFNNRSFQLALCFAILLGLARAFSMGLSPEVVFGEADNDDIMRLLSVRSWLDGQSWFDMTQYGILPPEGISLHWTRYIDIGLGGLILLLGLVLPPESAELWAVILWPTLLLIAFVAVMGYGTARLISPMAGIIAMFVVVAWSVISIGYFKPGRIDHHNVQILLLSAATFAALWPTAPGWAGAIAGLAAALSVSTGLETVFYLVGLGLLLVIQAAGANAQARRKLTAFSLTVILATSLAHIGQTGPAQWLQPMCDKLSPPYILVVWIAAAAALSPMALPPQYQRPAPRLGLTTFVAGLGLGAALPVLFPCLTDPYAHLPQEIQILISTAIIEAKPLAAFAAQYSTGTLNFFHIPVATVVLTVLLLLTVDHRSNRLALRHVRVLLCLAVVGALASTFQVRQVVLLAPVVPVLAGYALSRPFELRAEGRDRLSNMGLIAATILFVLPIVAGPRVLTALQPGQGGAKTATISELDCATPSLIAGMNALPPDRVLSPVNLGPKLAAFSHHVALAAPYHRSAQALSNGFFPFHADAKVVLLDWARKVDARYFVVCTGAAYGEAGTKLATGGTIAGFSPVGLDLGPLKVFTVTRIAE